MAENFQASAARHSWAGKADDAPVSAPANPPVPPFFPMVVDRLVLLSVSSFDFIKTYCDIVLNFGNVLFCLGSLR